jgi:hypothetical protein
VDWEGKTTVMIRNIPREYTQKALIAEVSRRGFAGTFDFFYLPMDFSKNANAGYAFANFIDVPSVTALRHEFDGRYLQLASTASKAVQVVPATLQGYDANFAHFAHSAVLNHHKTEHSPVFLRDGKLVTASRGKRNTGTDMRERLPKGRTLMLQKVPPVYSYETLFMELGVYGCGSLLEALHLPRGEPGTAYAVFHTDRDAAQFLSVLHGAPFTLAPGMAPMQADLHDASSAKVRSPTKKPLLATPRPMSFEYKTIGDGSKVAESPMPSAVLPELGQFSWEAFAHPAAPFEPEMLAAYAAMLNAYSTLPSTALHDVVAEAADKTLRELRPGLDDRFVGLGIDVDEKDEPSPLRMRGETWSGDTPLSGSGKAGASALTARWDPSVLVPPGPPTDWTPQRMRAVSAPISRSAAAAPGTVRGQTGSKGSPARAITPPTTTAGSSQGSSPVRTPRDSSASPDSKPFAGDAESPGMPMFDLPTLLPSPSALLSLKTPKGFAGFEHALDKANRV